MKRLIPLAAFAAALALAPAAWAHDGEEHEGHKAMEGMQHEGMHEDAAKDGKAETAKPEKKEKKHKKGKKSKQGKKHSKEGKAMETKKFHYVCPMHDGGESDKPGRCPKCGMDLVKEEIKGEDKAEGMHGHEGHEGHEGHDMEHMHGMKHEEKK